MCITIYPLQKGVWFFVLLLSATETMYSAHTPTAFGQVLKIQLPVFQEPFHVQASSRAVHSVFSGNNRSV